GMNGNPEVLTVSFVNDRLKLRNGQVLVGRYLDHVDVLEFVLPDCVAGAVNSIDRQEFLLQDRGGESRIQILKVFTLRDQLSSRGQDSGAGDTVCIDRVTEFRVAVNSGVTEIANGGNAALQILAGQLGAHESALHRRLDYCQQQSWCKHSVQMTLILLFGRHDDVEKKVRVAVDQPWQQRRVAQVEDFHAGRDVHLRQRSSLLDLVAFDQNGGRRKHVSAARIEESTSFDEGDRSGGLGAQVRRPSQRDEPRYEKDGALSQSP